jgi:hypothetical protein
LGNGSGRNLQQRKYDFMFVTGHGINNNKHHWCYNGKNTKHSTMDTHNKGFQRTAIGLKGHNSTIVGFP